MGVVHARSALPCKVSCVVKASVQGPFKQTTNSCLPGFVCPVFNADLRCTRFREVPEVVSDRTAHTSRGRIFHHCVSQFRSKLQRRPFCMRRGSQSAAAHRRLLCERDWWTASKGGFTRDE